MEYQEIKDIISEIETIDEALVGFKSESALGVIRLGRRDSYTGSHMFSGITEKALQGVCQQFVKDFIQTLEDSKSNLKRKLLASKVMETLKGEDYGESLEALEEVKDNASKWAKTYTHDKIL